MIHKHFTNIFVFKYYVRGHKQKTARQNQVRLMLSVHESLSLTKTRETFQLQQPSPISTKQKLACPPAQLGQASFIQVKLKPSETRPLIKDFTNLFR